VELRENYPSLPPITKLTGSILFSPCVPSPLPPVTPRGLLLSPPPVPCRGRRLVVLRRPAGPPGTPEMSRPSAPPWLVSQRGLMARSTPRQWWLARIQQRPDPTPSTSQSLRRCRSSSAPNFQTVANRLVSPSLTHQALHQTKQARPWRPHNEAHD
jgi:hypothetical protein